VAEPGSPGAEGGVTGGAGFALGAGTRGLRRRKALGGLGHAADDLAPNRDLAGRDDRQSQ
jgi:hypothetical protein